jgi:predicted DNA-binding transcriptional regulator AlpA
MQAKTTTSTEFDRLVNTREIEQRFGRTRRTIYQLIKRGKFPPPDVPGGLGASNQWYSSTVQRAFDDFIASAKARVAAKK